MKKREEKLVNKNLIPFYPSIIYIYIYFYFRLSKLAQVGPPAHLQKSRKWALYIHIRGPVSDSFSCLFCRPSTKLKAIHKPQQNPNPRNPIMASSVILRAIGRRQLSSNLSSSLRSVSSFSIPQFLGLYISIFMDDARCYL